MGRWDGVGASALRVGAVVLVCLAGVSDKGGSGKWRGVWLRRGLDMQTTGGKIGRGEKRGSRGSEG